MTPNASTNSRDTAARWTALSYPMVIAIARRINDSLIEQFYNRMAGALAHWNRFLESRDEADRAAFLDTAGWLVANEVGVENELAGWPISDGLAAPALSARAQGMALSVLWRAHLITGAEVFHRSAARAYQTFVRDILDGGVVAPLEDGSVMLEDHARYPAAHALQGYLVGLISLMDYADGTGAPEAAALVERLHRALPRALAAYDDGRWVALELLDKAPARPAELRELVGLLRAIVGWTGCAECRETATRWERYARSAGARALARAGRGQRVLSRAMWRGAGALLGLRRRRIGVAEDTRTGVSLPITAYPVAGGMRAVMGGWRVAMADDWRMEFLTAHRGPDSGDSVILRFTQAKWLRRGAFTPSLFPNVLLYVLLGFLSLRRVVRQRLPYAVILPQDGVFTAAFASVVGKLAGIRVVAVDHGNIADAFDPKFFDERRMLISKKRLLPRVMGYARLACYRPTLQFLARFATRRADHLLVASDDMREVYTQKLGVPAHRITRFPFMIDDTRYAPTDPAERMRLRSELGLPTDAIIITMMSRLHPMKGVDTGIRAVALAHEMLASEARKQLYLLIAGDGGLREQVAEQLAASAIAQQSRLWGEATADEVAKLLSVSDIFLFPARRSINSMAVLEAMSAGCATVATFTSPHIAEYLADERGIGVAVEDVDALASGLAKLVADGPRRAEMGRRAHEYVVEHHSASAVRPCLLRVTRWEPPAVISRT